MPHQDKDDLRTPLAELKALVRPFCDLDLGSVPRHGNAQFDQVGVVIMALLTFGWSQKQTTGERFDKAKRAARRIFKSAALAGSHQALMVALRACGDDPQLRKVPPTFRSRSPERATRVLRNVPPTFRLRSGWLGGLIRQS